MDFHCFVDFRAGISNLLNRLQELAQSRPTRIHLLEGNIQLSKAKIDQN
jgi:hypothetical protein